MDVDIVVPVRNEERDLEPSVRRLVAYLRDSFPFSARITIADNGSTDGTWAIASLLESSFPEVRAVRMELPGRGRALREIWSRSQAEVLAYMDVDLSTDLNALLPLVLLMTAAAYALVRAVESGRTRWLVLCGVLLGFGFLTKMLQAFLVVPGFALAYLWAGPPGLGKRLWQLFAGLAGIAGGAGWWVLAAQLTPAADRPYFGGSTNNSILQLALGYNGLGRLDGNETGSVGPGSNWGGPASVFRLFRSEFGGQVSWLLPAALIALAAMVWVSWRSPRTDRTRAAALIWGGWVLVTGGVFSFMTGIIHPYYMVALAPGIGALVGIGAMSLWQARLLGVAGGSSWLLGSW